MIGWMAMETFTTDAVFLFLGSLIRSRTAETSVLVPVHLSENYDGWSVFRASESEHPKLILMSLFLNGEVTCG